MPGLCVKRDLRRLTRGAACGTIPAIMHRLSYSRNLEALTFSTQCEDCIIPLVIRGHNDAEGVRLVEQCGCNYINPTVTEYVTDAEMVAAFTAKTDALIVEVSASAEAYARSYVQPTEDDGNRRPWNDQRPSREMVAALLDVASDDTLGGQILPAEELVNKYTHGDLVRLVVVRAEMARGLPNSEKHADADMVVALSGVASGDTADGRILPREELMTRYSSLELAQMVCARAQSARMALVHPTIALSGRR